MDWEKLYASYDWLRSEPEALDQRLVFESFAYYANALLKIRAKDRILKPLNIRNRPAQMILDTAIEQARKAGRPFEGVILKSRRQGISTYCEGRIFNLTTLNENTDSIIIAHDDDGVKTVFSYSKLFYDCLPSEWKPLKRRSNAKELCFENADEKTRALEPGLRSNIRVYKARNFAAARSQGTHAIHYSEVAFFPESTVRECVNSSLDTLQSMTDYLVFFESTANGVGGYFHDLWVEITSPDYRGNRKAFFFPWFIDPDNRLSLDIETARVLEADLDEEEKELRAKHRLTLEHLWWRRAKIDQKGGDMDLFRQEFPSTAVEAFIVSGNPVFSREVISKLILSSKDPIWTGEIETVDGKLTLFEHSGGSMEIWEKPLRDAEYVMGVDVGGEEERNDLAAVTVLRRTHPAGLAHVAAVWHGNIDAVNLADVVVNIARLYNDALVAIEINNQGMVTQNEVKKRYFNLFIWQHFDRFGISQTKKLGWETSMTTKPFLVAFGKYAVHKELVTIPSLKLIGEMQSFVKHGASARADGAAKDDLVMSFLIALYVLHLTGVHDMEVYGEGFEVPQRRTELLDRADHDPNPFPQDDEAVSSWMAL
jgi:hypothetical protein